MSTKINTNILKIQKAISTEIPNLIRFCATIFYCFIASCYSGWPLVVALALLIVIYSKTAKMIEDVYKNVAYKTIDVYRESEEIAS